MTDRDVVERVARLLNRAVVSTTPRDPTYKVPYIVSIKGAPAVSLMVRVRAELGTYRNEQIERALLNWAPGRVRWRELHVSCDAPGCLSVATTSGLCERHQNLWYKAVTRGHSTVLVPRRLNIELLETVQQRHTCDDECRTAWLAGLLEGEGCFSVARARAQRYPAISLQMCSEDVVRRAAVLLGAESVKRREPRERTWSTTFVTKIAGHTAAAWMLKLLPLMGQRRRAAMEAALAAYNPIRLVQPPATCVVPGCDDPHESRGLCHKHYMSWMRDVKKGRAPRVTPMR